MFDFNYYVKRFREEGYRVNVSKHNPFESYSHTPLTARVTGKGIIGCFGIKGQWYRSLNQSFAADNTDSFDKWSDCPIITSLVRNDEKDRGQHFVKLVKALKKLRTEDGKIISNSFNIIPVENDKDYTNNDAVEKELKEILYREECANNKVNNKMFSHSITDDRLIYLKYPNFELNKGGDILLDILTEKGYDFAVEHCRDRVDLYFNGCPKI